MWSAIANSICNISKKLVPTRRVGRARADAYRRQIRHRRLRLGRRSRGLGCRLFHSTCSLLSLSSVSLLLLLVLLHELEHFAELALNQTEACLSRFVAGILHFSQEFVKQTIKLRVTHAAPILEFSHSLGS